MNKVILMGRLTKDPDVRYPQGEGVAIARYTIAVDRRGKDKGTDFISCVAFGKGAEFAEKYLRKGTKICVSGRIQTGSYENKEGKKVYTTDVIIEEHEFAESKGDKPAEASGFQTQSQGFQPVKETPFDGYDDGELPFV